MPHLRQNRKINVVPLQKALIVLTVTMLYEMPVKMVQFPPDETWSSFTVSQANVKAVKAFVYNM